MNGIGLIAVGRLKEIAIPGNVIIAAVKQGIKNFVIGHLSARQPRYHQRTVQPIPSTRATAILTPTIPPFWAPMIKPITAIGAI